MSKYKIGDRVVVNDPASKLFNKVGTVIEESGEPWIRFEELTGHNYSKQGRSGLLGFVCAILTSIACKLYSLFG